MALPETIRGTLHGRGRRLCDRASGREAIVSPCRACRHGRERNRQEWPARAADFSAPAQWFTQRLSILVGGLSLQPRTKSLACWPLFPDDNPSLHFKPSPGYPAVSLEIGGGAQRSLVKITRREASAKKTVAQAKSLGNPAASGTRLNSTLRQLFPTQNAPMSIACTFLPRRLSHS